MSLPSEIVPSTQDFAVQQIQHTEEAGAYAAAKRQEAEIQSAMVIAKKFPRDELQAEQKINNSFGRIAMAEQAEYVYPRGGSQVRGPSVYAAREMARCWGNLRTGIDVVSETEEKVHIKGWAFDLETNYYIAVEDEFRKRVQRKRNGQTQWVSPDERDLRELINKRGSLLIRNAILQVIPRHITEAAVMQSRATLHKKASGQLKDSPEDVARKLVKAFGELGVTKEQLEKYLGRDVVQMEAEQYVDLQGVYKSLKDGNSRKSDHFPVGEEAKEKADDALSKLAKKEKVDKKTGEIKTDVEGQGQMFESLKSNGVSAYEAEQ